MTDQKNDAALIAPSDPLTALGLLSRLPVPAGDDTRARHAAWAYPLVGLVLGALAALVGVVAHGLGLPAVLCALLALATLIVSSGAMHEDGLADAADGLWGGWDRAARLEIMRDSRIGTYGVIALSLSITARAAALWLLYDISPATAAAALMAAGCLSRAGMPALMTWLPHARSDGLSHRVGQVSPATAALAGGLAIVAGAILLGSGVVWAVIWGGLAVLGVAVVAKRKIGGQTGDILGASQQLAEIAVLFALLA